MQPQEPMLPDPDVPGQQPGAPSNDPLDPDEPEEYDLRAGRPM